MTDALSVLLAGQVEPETPVTITARELADLWMKLHSQPVIEEAKGILMGHYGVDADTAFDALRRWSQDGNLKLRTVAQMLVDSVARHPTSEVPPHQVMRYAGSAHSQTPSPD